MERGPDERRAARAHGVAAEAWVADQLIEAGWTIRARNWRGGGGEIDLVAERDGCVRLVEVKLREPEDVLGDEALPEHKRALLRLAGRAWLAEHGEPTVEICFLVAFVDPACRAIRWIDDAFDG